MHIALYSIRNHGIAANVCIMLIFSAQAPGFVFFKKKGGCHGCCCNGIAYRSFTEILTGIGLVKSLPYHFCFFRDEMAARQQTGRRRKPKLTCINFSNVQRRYPYCSNPAAQLSLYCAVTDFTCKATCFCIISSSFVSRLFTRNRLLSPCENFSSSFESSWR